jgi:hypothetical protein
MLRSLAKIEGLMPQCKTVIMCDGYKVLSQTKGSSNRQNFKKALVTEDDVQNYNQYIDNVQQLCTSRSEYANVHIQRFEDNHGFANLVKRAVCTDDFVQTPLVFVVQHDWAFRRNFNLQDVLEAFSQKDSKLNYITWSSNSTVQYYHRLRTFYAISEPQPLQITPKIRIWPLDFFYDRNHIARKQFYRDRVFQLDVPTHTIPKRQRVKRFIEDSFGHHILNTAKAEGPYKLYESWGLAIYLEENEQHDVRPDDWKPILLHLDGRKYMTNEVLDKLHTNRNRKHTFVLETDDIEALEADSCSPRKASSDVQDEKSEEEDIEDLGLLQGTKASEESAQ